MKNQMIKKGSLVKAGLLVKKRILWREEEDLDNLRTGDIGIVVETKYIEPIPVLQHHVYWSRIERKLWFADNELEDITKNPQ